MNDPSGRHDVFWSRLQRGALLAAGTAVCLGLLGLFLDPRQFFQSYLLAFLYWWVATTGFLGWTLIHEMTGGRWGRASRPFLHAGVRTLPLIALAFVPLGFGLSYVYEWATPGFFAGDPHSGNRQWYFTQPFFLARAAFYLGSCLLLGLPLTWRKLRSADAAQDRTWPLWGGLGAVALTVIVSFAAVDWGMSLDPHWYSTMYGAVFAAGGLLTAISLVAATAGLLMYRLGRVDEGSRNVLHDLGKLLLACLMIWAYLQFSQFLITYAGNLPVEAVWYTRRIEGAWQWISVSLFVFHFALPFGLLLSRDWKREPRILASVAIGLAVVHGLSVFWMVVPSMAKDGFRLHWLDLALPVALGGLWIFQYVRHLKSRFVPVPADWPVPAVGEAR